MSRRPLGSWLFGKLPALGDFISRGIDFTFRDLLDHWLTAELEAARAHFGEEFEQRYLTAPAWCFIDCDPQGQWCGGAMCASVDAPGRKFPVIAGTAANDAGEAARLAGGCLEVLYEALAGNWDADRLHTSEIAAVGLAWQPEVPCWSLIGEDGATVELPGRFPHGVIIQMLEFAA